MLSGWSGRILRIDLSKKEYSFVATTPYTPFIGGRGINVKIMFDEVGPEVGPFDPENRIIFGPGVLTGTPAPASSRSTVTTLCPNGIIGSAGIGEFFGAEVRHAGYDNIIIQGKSDKLVYLYIHDDVVEFRDASKMSGKETIETQQLIRKDIGDPDVQIAGIGTAGENLVSFACIRTGLQSASGRGGMGAIMGSKNLKAVAVRGKRGINITKLTDYLKAANETSKMLLSHPILAAPMGKMQQAAMDVNDSPNKRGVSTFGNWEDIDWDEIEAKTFVRGGKEFYDLHYVSRIGCAGCPIARCYPLCNNPETGIGTDKCYSQPMFTFRVWNRDWTVMTTAAHLCNNYGLDILSTANIISFLMELYHLGIITEKDTDGISMERGSKEAIISTIHKIAKLEGYGKLFRDGVLTGAKLIGRGAEEFAMSVKGQEMGLHDFRGRKGTALAQAAATKMGGGEYPHPESVWHIGTKNPEAVDPTTYEGKGHMVWEQANIYKVMDMIGMCKNYFAWAADRYTLEYPARLFSVATGTNTSPAGLIFAAGRLTTLERAFDVGRGIRRKNDTLPPRMFETEVPGGPLKGQRLEREKFEKMLDEYYSVCGWDKDGVPTEETFKKYGLDAEWVTFSNRFGLS